MIRLASTCAALSLFAAFLSAQERRAPEKLEPGSSCAQKDCHAKLAAGTVVHRPVAKKTCDACHDQDDETLHKFTYFETGSKLCYGCHKSLTKGKKFTHAPLKDEKKPCLSCHEPHATASAHLMRAKTTSTRCLQCHTAMAEGQRFHKSRAVKGCIGCHDPHASNTAAFLRAGKVDLIKDLGRSFDHMLNPRPACKHEHGLFTAHALALAAGKDHG